MLDDLSPCFENLVKTWLDAESILEILDDQGISEEELLHILLREGHIIPPEYLQPLLRYGDDHYGHG